MIFEDIKNLLTAKFGEAVIVGEETTGLQPALLIAPHQIAQVCLELRDNPATYFDFLSCLSELTMVLLIAVLAWFITYHPSHTTAS